MNLSKLVDVFIVDDSAIVREILTAKLNATGRVRVVGSAIDPFVARNKLLNIHVDVIILDIEMPRMDGLTFLKYIMKYRPIPTIILSSLTDNKNQASLEALELGAIAVMHKPGESYSVLEMIDELTETIIEASCIDLSHIRVAVPAKRAPDKTHRKYLGSINTTHKLLAVGASTGGTVAMQTLFQDFTPEFPPTVAVIHMPERFTHTFAHRLNELCSVTVKEAEDRDIALQGCVYIAPGNKHLVIETSGANHILRVINGPRVFNQRPSVDVLFRSVADQVGGNSLGVLLTGMGRDGADGLLKMKEAGAFTITQDESSCVVYGMPKEAFELGASCIELPIEKIAGALNTRLSKKVQTKTGASYA